MIGLLVLALVVSCAHSLVVPDKPVPTLAAKPIPGTETYVEPQILLGQASGDVLWAVPAHSTLRANPVAPPPAALPPKPIPGTETYVEPQILLGQAPGDVLWAVPATSPLRPKPVVYTVEGAKALHNLRLNDPLWNRNNPIKTWEAVGPPTPAPAAPPAAV